MNVGLCVCIPSRGRMDQVHQVVAELLMTRSRLDTVVAVALDEDDETVYPQDRVRANSRRGLADDIILSIAPRERCLGDKFDRMLKLVPDAAAYMPFVDDCKFVSPGWDAALMTELEKFPHGLGMAAHPATGPGLYMGFALGGGMARLMRTIGVPLFPYWWEETWWDEVGKFSGHLLWRPDVHIIPWEARDIESAAGLPKTTTGIRDVVFWARFFDETRPVRKQQAQKLMDAAGDPLWRQEQVRSTWVAQTQMFEMRNSKLRNPAVAEEFERGLVGLAGVDEERYLGLKKDAQEMVARLRDAAEAGR